jgi:ketosteroid isomerase-like protein
MFATKSVAGVCHYGLAAFLICLPACTKAPSPPAPREEDIAKVVTAFYGAITAGDKAAAMHLIAPDAVFVESGKIETRAEYEANHLPADIDFEHQVKAVRGPLRITFHGVDTAWVISRAEYDEGNPEKYIITQLMVLTRDSGDWKIRTISWSSNQP